MGEQINKSFNELVELKYQLYNSLFLTLPFDEIEQTGLLIPFLQEACSKGFHEEKTPTDIINGFFSEHKPGVNQKEKIAFLFKIIQYVERQIVLIDALEEAAYDQIHRISDSNSWNKIKEKVKNRNLESKLIETLSSFGIRVVLTAHPTQFYPGRVLAIIADLTKAISEGDTASARDFMQQLGKTPFYRKHKPSAYNEAISLSWYLGNVFYPAIGEIIDQIHIGFSNEIEEENKLISLGFWPGGDRDGNPFVTADTTRKVANHLHTTILSCYYNDIKKLKRRLSFEGVYEILNDLEISFNKELTNASGKNKLSLNYLLNKLDQTEKLLIEKHQSLFLDKLVSFKRKVHLFGFYFSSLDIRQDNRIISKTFDAISEAKPNLLPEKFNLLSEPDQINHLLGIDNKIIDLQFEDPVIVDTIESLKVIREIQNRNGELGAHRFILSNCSGALDVAKLIALARISSWGNETLTLDIVPLFETIEDLKNAKQSMSFLYDNSFYMGHLENRLNKQTVMLGFSDGTKDGGYLMANWGIYKAKEEITQISRQYGVTVYFFDGRGGPPARGGGNAHMFYAALGKNIESRQIQMTLQGQTISSHYGIKKAVKHNMGYLLSAGIENNLFDRTAANISEDKRMLIDELSISGHNKYLELKQHPLFIPYLEERSTLKYYGLTNIGSRPTKRGSEKSLKFEDLRAIPFVGAWSQLKQNVPGFYGIGTALKEQEDKGTLKACIDLYKSSMLFKAMISNSMQSMSKTNFAITQYMKNDPKFGEFWQSIYNEFLLSKKMVLKVSGSNELLEDNARSRMSIKLREKVVLPLLTIQQYALIEIQNAEKKGNVDYKSRYEKMVVRSLFGNINASRNSV